MKHKEPKNINYCATVVEIKNKIELATCDNVVGTMICGCHVIIGKDTEIGTIGLYFPVETQLDNEFLSSNNLFRDTTTNSDNTKKGYFEENGRIKCIKFRGHQSNGLFIPIESLKYIAAKRGISEITDMVELGDEFDELYGIEICRKYIPKGTRTPGKPGSGNKGKGRKPVESKIIENQFRFHYDTAQLGRNLHKITPNSLISITYKVHGTSGISSKVLCKRKLTWFERILKRLKLARIFTYEYDYINSSRKVIKNGDLNPNPSGYYSEDIWTIAGEELKSYLLNGMTLYYEIVGYLPGGGSIQGSWDYGCKPGEHKIYVYRITFTNNEGQVFEFSAKQVQDWCKLSGLTPVIEKFYGYAWEFVPYVDGQDTDEWRDLLLAKIKELYNEKDCYLCVNKVPEEGVVVKVEGPLAEAFKQKSFRFLDKETRDLDTNKIDIETDN